MGGKPGGGTSHVGNVIECIRSRNKPHADIEIGHLSTRREYGPRFKLPLQV